MATSSLHLRSPYPPPSHPDAAVLAAKLRLIWFRHPGYPDTQNLLFVLDSSDDGGVHHETARLACAVLAGNRWDGFLCEDKEGHQQARTGPDEPLRASNYYFHLPGASDDKYSITPTFYHWSFPHEDLPESWKNAGLLRQLSSGTGELSCRLTLNQESIEMAQLIPAAQKPWFDMNLMMCYAGIVAVDPMKDVQNTIRLRSDIHTIFDAKRFAIVPKENQWVVHAFNDHDMTEVFRLYHNVPLQQLVARVQFLFARFAYTVFGCLRPSLQSGRSSWKLRLRVGMDLEERECTAAECVKFAMETALDGKSRSASAKKRQKARDADEALEEAEATDDEEQRGRKRRRTWELRSSSGSLVDSIEDAQQAVA